MEVDYIISYRDLVSGGALKSGLASLLASSGLILVPRLFKSREMAFRATIAITDFDLVKVI